MQIQNLFLIYTAVLINVSYKFDSRIYLVKFNSSPYYIFLISVCKLIAQSRLKQLFHDT